MNNKQKILYLALLIIYIALMIWCFIEKDYYSKNTTDIDSIILSNDKLLKIRKILKCDKHLKGGE